MVTPETEHSLFLGFHLTILSMNIRMPFLLLWSLLMSASCVPKDDHTMSTLPPPPLSNNAKEEGSNHLPENRLELEEKTTNKSKRNTQCPEEATWNDFLPTIKDSSALVSHKAYTLEYSEQHEQALWVAYLLTGDYVEGTATRTNDFREDDAVKTHSADIQDYKKSGYSRGHLCPAGDMKWDAEAMSETFLLSNMSPQLQEFNDGIWKKCEERVRNWAKKYDSLYVVTGPVLKPGLPTIGHNKVSIPEYYYKIVYDPRRQVALAFLVPHHGSKKGPKQFVVSIDEVEKVTGIDFFPALPDELEDKIESHSNYDNW